MSEYRQQQTILGFDPGRDKCGIAVMGLDRTLYENQVVSASMAIAEIQKLCSVYVVTVLVIGNQTTAKQWRQHLSQSLPPSLPIVSVDERFSTLEARSRYWQLYPPKGLSRLIPEKIRSINRPIDDIAALILIERYLEHQI